MNFIPSDREARLDVETIRGRERELQIKAEADARAHEAGDGSEAPAGAIRRALEHARAALRRRS
ncbi:MAG: hypothetical protein ACTHMY_06720 [Solirubrobacteraceae bacterium]